tara:strand:+ start:586 stop:747 length:162 start_codon:yes stop_codon:yes gene_type:complete
MDAHVFVWQIVAVGACSDTSRDVVSRWFAQDGVVAVREGYRGARRKYKHECRK